MVSVLINDLELAIAAIAEGHLCAIPTETVYGLAADAQNSAAVSRIFVAKNRPQDHPLIVHICDYSSALDWLTDLPKWAHQLAESCWPGPLTIVGQRSALATDQITGGQSTVAVRVPNHELTLQLLKRLKLNGISGVVAPSANRFGHVSPTTAEHVFADLGDYLTSNGDLILDGGPCDIGIESTIVLAIDNSPIILRPGAVSAAIIEAITGLEVQSNDAGGLKVSGSLASHYAPRAKVNVVSSLASQSFDQGSGFIALSEIPTPFGLTRLAEPATADAFASDLYRAFREGDELGLAHIYLVLPEDTGIGLAIADRVKKAAHPDKEKHS